jgi:hypothetical protein
LAASAPWRSFSSPLPVPSQVLSVIYMNLMPDISPEWVDWYLLTPEERWRESSILWNTFLSLGGSLEPEPDTDSPFFDAPSWRPLPVDGRPGVRVLRRCGI